MGPVARRGRSGAPWGGAGPAGGIGPCNGLVGVVGGWGRGGSQLQLSALPGLSYPDGERMPSLAPTIYRALSVQARGSLGAS